MKSVLGVLCLVALSLAHPFTADENSEWEQFTNDYEKSYPTKHEEEIRKKIYFQNKDLIQSHNALYHKGQKTFEMKMNQLGDKSSAEVRAYMNGYNKTMGHAVHKSQQVFKTTPGFVAPQTVDWRDKGAVTPIKDYGQCGAYWAFTTTESIEGQLFLKKQKRISLSEQNLMDCTWDYGNRGCSGGLVTSAFQYIIDNKGIDTESSYPYIEEHGKCWFSKSGIGATLSGYVVVESGNEDALKEAIATIGPLPSVIDANHDSFQFYASGVYNEEDCSSIFVNFDVTIVGYGTDDGEDYWIVKNHWNTLWGDDGYIKMARNKNNQCGIATRVSYPVL